MKFDSYHPLIQFVYFVAMFTCICLFRHPVFMAIAYVSAFVWSVKLNGKKALIFNMWLIPCIFLYNAWYASYHHFGMTILWYNRIGNQMTLESIVSGFVRGVVVATVIMEFSCVFATVTSDKIVYLLGRVSPKLSLFFSILLRSVPRIKAWVRKADCARQGVGMGIGQGNLWQRFCHLMGLISITITWAVEHLIESAASMKCRGYSLKGRKAFSIYRFDDRDRCFLVGLVFCIMTTYMAHAAGETVLLYQPMILFEPITGVSLLFYVVYAGMAFLPLAMQVFGEWRFKQLQKNIDNILAR